jgi:hypothetical protein
MGSSTSSESNTKSNKTPKFDTFENVIDYIASYYILTSDFKTLTRLADKEYCDKLVILTSDIVNRSFNETQITYLAQRIKNGEEVNEMAKDKVIFLEKDKFEELDAKNDVQKNIRKKRLCIGIAKFYVKIAHTFAAIMKTINPVYTYIERYQDYNGEYKEKKVEVNLLERRDIPKDATRVRKTNNICENRIESLLQGQDPKGTLWNIHPSVCDLNIKNTEGVPKSLLDEPGIPELMRLYYDDEYDYSTGTFKGMSPGTKKQYMNDLRNFYTVFTGQKNMPSEITKFSDIKLRDYTSSRMCKSDKNSLYKKGVVGSTSSGFLSTKKNLFKEYARNVQAMIELVKYSHKSLLGIINELFSFVDVPFSNTKKIE